jgi:Fe-S cluster biogenesis protein NfuA
MFGFRKEKYEAAPAEPASVPLAGEVPGGQGPQGALASTGARDSSAEPATGSPTGTVSERYPYEQEQVYDEEQGADSSLSDEERAERLRQLTELVDMVRPIIQQDGGDLVLLDADVEAGTVELQLQGACSSCAISATTLQAGVERILKDRLPWVTEVIGGVDEDIDWYESAAMGRGAYVPKW